MAKTKLQMQDIVDSTKQSFDPFVSQSLIDVPYTTISNRAKIPDLANDLKARMGIERIVAQEIYQKVDEFGPNGEPVWAVINDTFDQIRLVGNWINRNANFGQGLGLASALGNDYIEVTFYGTGLNLLASYDAAGRDYRVSVDGGAEGSNIYIAGSSVIATRNYSTNGVINLVSGLSLGLHTIKIRNNSANGFFASGFEILNESLTIKVQPGNTFLGNRRYRLNSQQSLIHNSSFDSGTLQTKGGRVLVYQKEDGSISKAVQPVDADQANLTSANHINEDIARIYNWREFGASRSDDFSLFYNTVTPIPLAFTLDDGTTSLVSSGSITSAANSALLMGNNGSFIIITFVGCGLDIIQQDSASGGADNYTITVDNTLIGSLSGVGSTSKRTVKIVSGLPYGTHTVKITRVTASTFALGLHGFIAYQPKKPTIPDDAVELADYNIMADYSSLNSTGAQAVSAGILRKHNTRELIYVGTWAATLALNNGGGWTVSSSTNNDYYQYTFVGTGVELRLFSTAISSTRIVSIDGSSNLSSYTTSYFGTGITSFTPATGTLVTSTTAVVGNRLTISGLTFGVHTVKVLKSAGATTFGSDAIDVITPIHSYKSNLYSDLQNTMSVGSNSISDSRNISALKERSSTKSVAQAIGIVSAPSTNSSTYIPIPDMSVTHYNKTGKIKVSFSGSLLTDSSSVNYFVGVFVNGQQMPVDFVNYDGASAGSQLKNTAFSYIINVPTGHNKVDIYWRTSASVLRSETTRRILTVEEV